jgi:hypothetical protein
VKLSHSKSVPARRQETGRQARLVCGVDASS